MAEVTSQLRRRSVTWWLALPEAFADWTAPTAAELNGPLSFNVTCAFDEDSTSMSLGDSDTDDRYSFCTESGIDVPTSLNPEAELGFYRDADRTASGAFADAFNLLRHPDIPLYIVKRVGDQDNDPEAPAAVGDKISMQYTKNDFGVDVVAAEDPAMMSQTPLQQGRVLWQYEIQA
jgi:hypothetical protein